MGPFLKAPQHPRRHPSGLRRGHGRVGPQRQEPDAQQALDSGDGGAVDDWVRNEDLSSVPIISEYLKHTEKHIGKMDLYKETDQNRAFS